MKLKNKNTFIYVVSLTIIILLIFNPLLSGESLSSKSKITPQTVKTIQSTDDVEYWGLLIAVAEYADDPSQNRPLMLREVEELHETLLQYDCWEPDHIKVITAKEATPLGIIKGFQWLDEHEDENDISLIYFTTHGFPLGIDIPPKDEADGTDEALVTYWGFAYENSVIWDDELNFLLGNLESEGICLIVDSCFAGGFNDPEFKLNQPWSLFEEQSKEIMFEKYADEFAQELTGKGRVVVMASREDEVSYSGVFAPFVVDALRGFGDTNQDGFISAEEVYRYAKPRCFWQTPTIYDNYPGELFITSTDTEKNQEESQSNRLDEEAKESDHVCSNIVVNNPSYTARVCGNITSASTDRPLSNAVIQYFGIDENGNYYRNHTTSNKDGFYQFLIPPGQFMIREINIPGYCSDSSAVFEIKENETVWLDFALQPIPPGNSTIKGFITNQKTLQAVESATVLLRWSNDEGDHYYNQTVTNTHGFYELTVAEGTIDLSVEADGYEPREIEEIQIIDHETKWINLSLYQLPQENAIASGYVTESETGIPIANLKIQIEWQDGIGHRYYKNTKTDADGFYEFIIASGEIYLECYEYGYEYKTIPRHDVKENQTTWINFTFSEEQVYVDFIKPLQAIYIEEQRLTPFSQTILFGETSFEILPRNFWYDEVTVEKIEIFLDDTLFKIMQDPPFEFKIGNKNRGVHEIVIKAYENNQVVATNQLSFLKI